MKLIKVKCGDVLSTNNEGFGFYGTLYSDLRDDNIPNFQTIANQAWNKMSLIVKNETKSLSWDDKNVRDFLDSRMGRHLANKIYRGKGKIDFNVSDLKKNYIYWYIDKELKN